MPPLRKQDIERNSMTDVPPNELAIWCLMDGKAGHQNQVRGLAEAIQRRRPARIHPVELKGWNRGFRSVFGRHRQELPRALPDFIIGAGHASHVPLCVFRKRFGGRSVVLMKPTLPLAWFDICLVPDVHRLPRVPPNVILTKGVLNHILPNSDKDVGNGLFLIGGPSAHYRWSTAEIFRQISTVIQRGPDIKWTVATSRRTPEDFCSRCDNSNVAVQLIRPDDVGPDWLPGQLSAAETVWVSEDSVSMTYESLTSGSHVGVLELQRNRSNRVTDCIDTLVDAEYVTRWSRWEQTGQLSRQTTPFCEAERCAKELLKRTVPKATRDQTRSRAA